MHNRRYKKKMTAYFGYVAERDWRRNDAIRRRNHSETGAGSAVKGEAPAKLAIKAYFSYVAERDWRRNDAIRRRNQPESKRDLPGSFSYPPPNPLNEKLQRTFIDFFPSPPSTLFPFLSTFLHTFVLGISFTFSSYQLYFTSISFYYYSCQNFRKL